MTLSTGTRLGVYEVVAPLGAGGMGEVYRARDTKLNREVALKVLPPAFSSDPQYMARLEREAQMLAALNHPNIAAIYGLEGEALVMELVEGETLAQRIAQGPVALDEAIQIARQIAEGLETAHDKGIIHRDLKPENIKITPGGMVKILDFGLAKAAEEPSAISGNRALSPTLSLAMTQAGMILGTAAYMSPEQARGKPVDRRADIWAFGVVLYEMLVGRQLFGGGETVSDSLAAVITREPDWALLPQDTPTRVRDLLCHCLQKDARQRLQHIGDARWELEQPAPVPLAARPNATAMWALAGLLPGLLLAAWVWLRGSSPPAQPTARFSVVLSEGEQLATYYPPLAISPDGASIAYSSVKGGVSQIYLRTVDRIEVTPIPGTDEGRTPFFSPDGKWLAFFARGQLKKVPLGGGPPVPLCAAIDDRGGTWTDDQTIVFAPDPSSGLFRVSAVGGMPTPLTTLDAGKQETSHRWPQALPGGKAILFTIKPASMKSYDEARLAVLTLKDGKCHTVVEGGSDGRYVSTGHIVYARSGELVSVPFDLGKLATTGPGSVAVKGITEDPGTGAGFFSVSAAGHLVFAPGGLLSQERTLHLVDRSGHSQPVAAPARAYFFPQVSPDGRRVVTGISAPYDDIWIYDLDRGGLTRFTFATSGGHASPIWSPDGKWIAMGFGGPGGKNEILKKPATGGGAEETLYATDVTANPSSWSPDGRTVALGSSDRKTGDDISMLSLGADGHTGRPKPQPFLQTVFAENQASFSPDGRWVAYSSNESGRFEIYVKAYRDAEGQWPVSIEGGTEPVWARSGRELFFRTGSKMMVVDVDSRSGFRSGKPRMLFEGDYVQDPGGLNYSVLPGDRQFLMLKQTQSRIGEIRVVLNWFEELKRAMPGGR